MDSQYDEVKIALSFISSDCTRDEWFKILCSTCDALGQNGYELAKNWSMQSPKFNQKDFDSTWRSIKPGAITKSTLFDLAYKNGMPRPVKSEPISTTKKESGLSQSQDEPPSFDEPPIDVYNDLGCTTSDSSEFSSHIPNQPIANEQKAQNLTPNNTGDVLSYWNSLKPFHGHEYIVNKKLTDKLNGYEVHLRTGYAKNLGKFFAYPLLNLESQQIVGFNRISISGKMLAKNSKKSGAAAIIGQLNKETTICCICESLSDGLHIHDFTKTTVLVANDEGNLKKVTENTKKLHPQCKIVICADNDDAGRKGANYALNAVKGINAVIVYPNLKDFSDDYVAGDLTSFERVKQAIENNSIATAAATSEVTTEENIPSGECCFRTYFNMCEYGLFHHTTKYNQSKNAYEPVDTQITLKPFEIVAKTHDSYYDSWSKLVTFQCDSGHTKQVVIPFAMTSGNGEEYRKILLDSGLPLFPDSNARRLLTEYLVTTEPSKTLHCLDKTGWYNGVYVLPGQVIGTTNEEILLQTSNSIKESYESKGTLEEWQEKVARYCIGNSRLTFAVSYAFASMLLEFSDADSGGVQFIGQSSIGKSTVAFVAASVFGGRSYVNQWRNTSNALESVATARNDSLLILDEMGQVESKEVGAIAYMLANGSGKGRMDKSANLKPTSKWRLLFLSTGEVGLVDHMKSSGKQTMAGQESRLIDLPADTGQHGIFENLHECKDGSELSRLLRSNTKKFYGTAQSAFLTRLLQTFDTNTLIDEVDNLTNQFLDEYVPQNSDGQVKRVAQRFALAVIGGQIATMLGITGWPEGESEKAAATCFNDWLQARGGTGSIETKNALQQVRYFFEQFGFSRFKDIKAVGTEDEKTVQNLAGFRETTGVGDDAETCFYVYPGVFAEEICKGLNRKLVIEICLKYGLLEQGSEKDRPDKKKRLPLIGQKRVFHFTSKVLGD